MKIYTRGGDKGKTALIGGRRRFKHDLRVEAYGSVDEAGAFVGLAATELDAERDRDVLTLLLQVQHRLWDVGADLAISKADDRVAYRTSETAARELEPEIDRYHAECPAITKFILRGGTRASAALHVACTVVRRAERRVVALMQMEPVPAPVLQYLNRLSDLLFVLARVANARDHREDVPYENSPDVFHS